MGTMAPRFWVIHKYCLENELHCPRNTRSRAQLPEFTIDTAPARECGSASVVYISDQALHHLRSSTRSRHHISKDWTFEAVHPRIYRKAEWPL